MSGVRLEQERVSGVWCHSLRDQAFLAMLRKYRKLLVSAYGPKGGSILISNAIGRESLASSSSEIIKEVSFSHPCVKYINALVSAQNAAYGLHGLYTGILCVRLLEEALHCEDDTPHHVVLDISEWIISELLASLAENPEEVVVDLDIGDMKLVTSFVKTILGTKNCHDLSKKEQNDLSISIVKAFLRSIPHEYSNNGFGHVNIIESASLESKVCDGVLIREPDICPQKVKRLAEMHDSFNILAFTIPLQFEEGKDETLQWRGNKTKETTFLDIFIPCLIACMKKRNIHILANQMSVHPVIKFELERKGYLVLERLGTASMQALIKLCGCKPISNLSNPALEMSGAALGKINTIESVTINEKNYIILDHAEGCVSTLLLPKSNPCTAAILKESVESCLAALRMVVVDSKIVAGGGCLESWIALKVGHLISNNHEQIMSLVDVQLHHITKVASMFVRVFMDLAFKPGGGASSSREDWCVDSTYHHLWPVSVVEAEAGNDFSLQPHSCHCVCGLVMKDSVNSYTSNHWQLAEFHLNFDVKDVERLSCSSRSWSQANDCTRLGNSQGSRCSVKNFSNNDAIVDEYGFLSLELDGDSLEERIEAVEEDLDSLEKTGNSLEEEGDSLEGRLESLDEDVDSLEDILDRITEASPEKGSNSKRKLEAKVSDGLYDCFSAKYNGIRLALEGFSQLFKIGECVFDK